MKSLCLLVVGVVVGLAASGVDWSREAVGQVTDSITGKPINSYDGDASLDLNAAPVSNVSIDFSRARSAAPESPALVGRFQVSAYGSPNGHGCYIVDTMTGKTLHVANGQQPQIVAEALSPQSTHSVTPGSARYDELVKPFITPTPAVAPEPLGIPGQNVAPPVSESAPKPQPSEVPGRNPTN